MFRGIKRRLDFKWSRFRLDSIFELLDNRVACGTQNASINLVSDVQEGELQ